MLYVSFVKVSALEASFIKSGELLRADAFKIKIIGRLLAWMLTGSQIELKS